jgi:hypothetical protein
MLARELNINQMIVILRDCLETDKSTKLGGKMRKRDVKRLSFPLVILFVLVFGLMVPSLATAELYTDSGLDFRIPESEELELHFSTPYEDTDLMLASDTSYNSYDEQLGYWFEDIPWLGIASEAPLLQPEEENQDISIDADTNLDPLSGFLLLRYPKWRPQPFVGIGPTFFVSDLTNDTVDSLRHIFMGIHYNF